ncbi:MAG: SDR family oxidoreductase [Armatimonadetes bacterium]|nr:SDR family oxidoreductase [Armatimonadota bacterium]
MDLGIEGKVALVCAASKGLGYASALCLAREGAKIAICSRTKEAIEAAAQRIREETGAEVLPLVADVTKPEDLDRVVQETTTHFGTVHILVPNSGGPPAGTFETLDDSKWEIALDSTLRSTIHLVRAVLPNMKAQGWGRIIVITSTSAKQPIAGLLLSNTIRAGVIGLLKTLSQEFAEYGITVNNVAPGSFATDRITHLLNIRANNAGISVEEAKSQMESRIPLRRLGSPEELGSMVAYLSSESASYITGQTLVVDGGQTLGL